MNDALSCAAACSKTSCFAAVAAVLALAPACATKDATPGFSELNGDAGLDAAAGASATSSGGGGGAGGAAGARGDGGSAPRASGGTATAAGGAPPAPDTADSGDAQDAPEPSKDAATPDAGDSSVPHACGQGILTSDAAYTFPGEKVATQWFGGDDRTPTAEYPQFHHRNVAQGVAFTLPYDTIVETIGVDVDGPFKRASDSTPLDVMIRSQVRDGSGKVLYEPPRFAVPKTITAGFIDIPVHAWVPANTTRIITYYVEGGLESGAFVSVPDAQFYYTDARFKQYSAVLHDYVGSPPANESVLSTDSWSGLWYESLSAPVPFQFRITGCQEVCATTSCDDGNACTDDLCTKETGACTHPKKSCDDGISCTVDSCATATGCIHAPNASLCPAQPHCNAAKACSPVTGCGVDCSDSTICTADRCDEESDRCVHEPAALKIDLSDDLDYTQLTLHCGESGTYGSDTCSLSSDGLLSLSANEYDDEGNPVASGCSEGRNRSCCFHDE